MNEQETVLQEAPESAGQEPSVKKKKGTGKVVILVIIAALLLGYLYFGSYTLMKKWTFERFEWGYRTADIKKMGMKYSDQLNSTFHYTIDDMDAFAYQGGTLSDPISGVYLYAPAHGELKAVRADIITTDNSFSKDMRKISLHYGLLSAKVDRGGSSVVKTWKKGDRIISVVGIDGMFGKTITITIRPVEEP